MFELSFWQPHMLSENSNRIAVSADNSLFMNLCTSYYMMLSFLNSKAAIVYNYNDLSKLCQDFRVFIIRAMFVKSMFKNIW